jgi:hypothetical protein
MTNTLQTFDLTKAISNSVSLDELNINSFKVTRTLQAVGFKTKDQLKSIFTALRNFKTDLVGIGKGFNINSFKASTLVDNIGFKNNSMDSQTNTKIENYLDKLLSKKSGITRKNTGSKNTI